MDQQVYEKAMHSEVAKLLDEKQFSTWILQLISYS